MPVEKLKPCRHNIIRTKKLRDKHLITTNSGSFIAFSEAEYIRLSQGNPDKKLFSWLEEKGIIITEDNEQGIIEHFRKKNEFLFQGTSLHIVIVTLRCNQADYCQASP